MLAIIATANRAQAWAQDVAAPDRLNLSEPCDEGGTSDQSKCLRAQGQKADRWLKNIFDSYRLEIADLPDRVKKDGLEIYDGYDPVGNLVRSQTQFEAYRKTMEAFAYDAAYPGSLRQIEAPMVYFNLTVDRAKELLQSCGYDESLPDIVDLTSVAWCQHIE